MKQYLLILFLFSIAFCSTIFSCNHQREKPKQSISDGILVQVDSFASLCSALQVAVAGDSLSEKELQHLFLRARLAYKKFEWAAEYFDPATTRVVNGPPVVEVESPDQILDPAGLQVIEGYLFPEYDTSRKKLLIGNLYQLQSGCDLFRTRFKQFTFSDWQIFDAMKLEVFRVITLGISGFDNPLTRNSMEESAVAMESIQQLLMNYNDNGNADPVMGKLDSTVRYLKANTDFNAFNRMEFIISYGNPVTIGISDLEQDLHIQKSRYNRLLNQDAKTLFDSNAFNVNAYAPDHSSFISADKIVLGQKLFSDPVLSGTGKRSCQSCHQPAMAFADGLVKNTVIGKAELLGRNTPTLINAALQPALFYDLRVNSLEDQSHSVVHSNKEMHGSLAVSVKRLWQDKQYRKMFLKAFPFEDSTRVDTFEVMNAIGSYIRSLVFLNSRFDLYMRGDRTSMNMAEINGFNLFMGKAKCATCHYMPLFNGTFPPGFKKIESEVIGVPREIGKKDIDPDPGRYAILKNESFRHAFKTPTVRNAARTAPYMHNGVFQTLAEVIDFYNRGGGAGLGIHIENQTLPVDSLGLSRKEQDDIIAFIKTLDSKLPAR